MSARRAVRVAAENESRKRVRSRSPALAAAASGAAATVFRNSFGLAPSTAAWGSALLGDEAVESRLMADAGRELSKAPRGGFHPRREKFLRGELGWSESHSLIHLLNLIDHRWKPSGMILRDGVVSLVGCSWEIYPFLAAVIDCFLVCFRRQQCAKSNALELPSFFEMFEGVSRGSLGAVQAWCGAAVSESVDCPASLCSVATTDRGKLPESDAVILSFVAPADRVSVARTLDPVFSAGARQMRLIHDLVLVPPAHPMHAGTTESTFAPEFNFLSEQVLDDGERLPAALEWSVYLTACVRRLMRVPPALRRRYSPVERKMEVFSTVAKVSSVDPIDHALIELLSMLTDLLARTLETFVNITVRQIESAATAAAAGGSGVGIASDGPASPRAFCPWDSVARPYLESRQVLSGVPAEAVSRVRLAWLGTVLRLQRESCSGGPFAPVAQPNDVPTNLIRLSTIECMGYDNHKIADHECARRANSKRRKARLRDKFSREGWAWGASSRLRIISDGESGCRTNAASGADGARGANAAAASGFRDAGITAEGAGTLGFWAAQKAAAATTSVHRSLGDFAVRFGAAPTYKPARQPEAAVGSSTEPRQTAAATPCAHAPAALNATAPARLRDGLYTVSPPPLSPLDWDAFSSDGPLPSPCPMAPLPPDELLLDALSVLEPVQPSTVQPSTVQPSPVEPSPVQPSTVRVQPSPVEPSPVQPSPVQPSPVQPSPVQPLPVQSVPPLPHSSLGPAAAVGLVRDAGCASDAGVAPAAFSASTRPSIAELFDTPSNSAFPPSKRRRGIL